jgi:hypothetical protein
MSEQNLEYQEVGHLHRQKVRIAGEQAVVTGNLAMSGDYEARIPLEAISTMVSQGNMRSKAFHQYLAVMFATSAVAVVYHAIPGTTVFEFWGSFLTFLPSAFLVASLATIRKFRFAAFTNHSGSILFSVSQIGPHRQDFDTFIVELRHLVERSQPGSTAP